MRYLFGWIGLAVFLSSLAALLLGLAFNLLPPDFFDRPLNLWLAAFLLGGSLGLFLLLNSGLSASPRPRPFIFDRGEARRGHLTLHAGAIDFNVSAHAPDMAEILAGGQAAGGHAPRYSAQGGEAWIEFPRRPLPLLGADATEVTLTPNMPWQVEARTDLGNLELDLFALSVPDVEVRGWLGDIHLICPAVGVTNASLSTWLGDARVEVPDGVAARISAMGSKYAEVKVDERRFSRRDDGGWASPDFAAASHRLTLNVKTTFGHITIV